MAILAPIANKTTHIACRLQIGVGYDPYEPDLRPVLVVLNEASLAEIEWQLSMVSWGPAPGVRPIKAMVHLGGGARSIFERATYDAPRLA